MLFPQRRAGLRSLSVFAVPAVSAARVALDGGVSPTRS